VNGAHRQSALTKLRWNYLWQNTRMYTNSSLSLHLLRKAEQRQCLIYNSVDRKSKYCASRCYVLDGAKSHCPPERILASPDITVLEICAIYPRLRKRRETHTRIQRNADLVESPYRAFQPSQRFNLALPLPLGPCLDPAAAGPVPERLELLPNSYCLLLPGRPPLTLALVYVSLHSSLQNHLVLPVGGLSRCTQPRWNHSRGQSSLSQAIMLPYDTSLQ
jgi:hypothetical protein